MKTLLILTLLMTEGCAVVPTRSYVDVCFDKKAYAEERAYYGCIDDPVAVAKNQAQIYNKNGVQKTYPINGPIKNDLDSLYYRLHPNALVIYNEMSK